MPRRIDIELTSALDDGSWTWRAAGARQPRGVLDGSILPGGAKVGDELKVEIEQEMDGITVLSVVQGRAKPDRDLLELLPVEREFQPIVETRAPRSRGARDGRPRRPRRDDGDRRDRRDGDRRDRRDGDRRDRRDGEGRRGGRGGDRRDGGRRGHRDDGGRRRGGHFTPPPEVPTRPRPKRLKPGKRHRTAILAELPEEQRPIAELALQGMGAVRQRVRSENEKAKSEGRPEMPEATVLKMAEELLPKLRVAEWLDRADAAKRQMEHLDLRDLRSVVAAANDPVVARDESTIELAEELRAALVTKQDEELQLWFGDVDAALAVGRVVRALRLSSQPPKAGVPFPVDIAQRLVDSTNAALAPMDSPERWSAMLEAAAFSPIRQLVQPVRVPDEVNDELRATVTRLAPLLPQVAALFEIEVDPKAPMPKPLRTGPRRPDRGDDRRRRDDRNDRGRRDDRDEREPRRRRRDDAAAAADKSAPEATGATTDAAPEAPAPEVTESAPEAPAPEATVSAPEAAPEVTESAPAEPAPESAEPAAEAVADAPPPGDADDAGDRDTSS